jgi:hypothetical protein
MFRNDLRTMVRASDGEVGRENGHRVAEDQVLTPVQNAFLPLWKMAEAEKTWPPVYILFVHASHSTFHSSRILLEKNGESITGERPLADAVERFIAVSKKRPCQFLLGEERETEMRKIAGGISSVEFGVDLSFEQ